MSLKLFAVRCSNGKLLCDDAGKPVYFAKKPDAKAARDTLVDAHVALGPYHRRHNENA